MRGGWMREAAGWLGAVAVALLVSAQVAASARSELLFRDGDSLVVAMIARSLLDGQPLDWAMSSVLFLPETAVFAALSVVLPFDVNGVLAANGVLNLVALYGALRLVAGRRRDGAAPAAWSLLALLVFGIVAMTEASASRDALELASLQLTTTYYSATVVAVVATVGMLRRALDHERLRPWLLFALFATAVVSTTSNPLYAAWATVPFTLVLAIFALRRPGRGHILVLSATLIVGTAVGFLGRIPFSAWIANTGASYAQPAEWMQSLGYYAGLAGERLTTPGGWLAALVLLALIALAAGLSARSVPEPFGERGAHLVAAIAWVTPVLVIVGAIALGTHAARYLQPLAFAPVLALVAAPRALRIPFARPLLVPQAVLGSAAVLLLLSAAIGIPRLASAAARPDADLVCVTDWVNEAGRPGAGQFWTVRLPKLHLEDPTQLVQVDHRLNGYAWLVNRTDFAVSGVSFLIEDSRTVQWELPVAAIPGEVVQCGRYSILDFGETSLPLGTPHS
ncbi:hypothetical protein [Microbacterium sp. LWH12-1.2]|uniref:hypothetical protein n=1 Tax=Microbacterium sp. LWH12-1.2 TaxID=3135259 RepID=UPI0034272C96